MEKKEQIKIKIKPNALKEYNLVGVVFAMPCVLT